jgi:hypothetical protein
VGSLDNGVYLVRLGLGQDRTHRFTSLVLIVIDGFSELLSGTMLSALSPFGFATAYRLTRNR